MRYVRLGKTDLEVSEIAFGTWAFGGEWGDFDRNEATASIHRALDLGVNLTWWDSALNTPQTRQMVQAAGLNFFRFPGGSSADTWHFNVGPTWNGEGTSPNMASFIAALGGTGLVTLNYGTASPQENAALLAYLNAPVGSTCARSGQRR